MDALNKHIQEEHIDPQLTLACPLDSCSEIVQKTNLPSHQAQHQLDTYNCALENCLATYPSYGDLLDHAMTTHGGFDCRFGGCEVSLKDPMQLQNHVVEDHLDLFNQGWYSPYGQQYLPQTQQGDAPIVPIATSDQDSFAQYVNSTPSYPYEYVTGPTAFGHCSGPQNVPQPVVQSHPTYADQAQSAWEDSVFVKPSSAKPNSSKGPMTVSSPLSIYYKSVVAASLR
ncbi:MAG: hypothetical protein Q9183_003406 [Haloplaca sp. 2 TL-2023]